MKPDETRSDTEVEYKNLLNVLIRTGKYLEELSIDPVILKSYRGLLRYLRGRPATSLPEILGGVPVRRARSGQASEYKLSDREILSMNPERILNLATDKDIPRREIERIAAVRFGMTPGGLSTLRNRDALVEKLRTLIGNEGTHESITRAAAKHQNAR